MRSPAQRQALSVLFVGAGGFSVDAAVLLFGLSVLHLGPIGARIASFLVAVTFTWQLNRRFSFSDARKRRGGEYFRYLLVSVSGFTVNFAVYSVGVLNSPLLRSYPLLALVAASAVGLALNFFGYKFLVFGRK